jgi:AraC-like DNA-binding protein
LIHRSHKPSPELSNYVVEIVYNKDYFPSHEMDKYLPDGTLNIVFELTGTPKYIFDHRTKKVIQECNDVWFSGVFKDYITISSRSEEMMVVVVKPGAGFPLIKKPAHLFTNKVVQAQTVFGKSITDLHLRLKEPTAPEEKFEEIEHWLQSQFFADDFYSEIIRFAIVAIENAPSLINITSLAKKSGYSQKQFIQLFKKYVGITPKQFHRIVRFNEILSALENNEELSWTIIAMDCGYYDQSHFIKDFQSFSGLNPRQYLSDIGSYPNFFPVK